MDVHLTNPRIQKQLNELAQCSGRDANELVADALAGYLYDDLKSGRLRPINGEDALARFKVKSEERRNGRA